MATKLDSRVFDAPIREDLIHAVVVAQQGSRRSGTASTKNRAAVSGGGRKPWRQKGTGRARHGTIRSPIWAGGGVTFGPQPRSFEQRVPKKMRRAALRSALSLRNKEGKVSSVEEFDLPELKTRRVLERLRSLEIEDVLILTPERDFRLERACRNLPRVRTLPVAGLNVLDVLSRKHLLLVGNAGEAIVERLQ